MPRMRDFREADFTGVIYRTLPSAGFSEYPTIRFEVTARFPERRFCGVWLSTCPRRINRSVCFGESDDVYQE